MATISVQRVDTTEDDSGFSGVDLVFQLTLSAPLASEVSVQYFLSTGTAEIADLGNVDLVDTVTFAAGEVTKLLSFRINGDNLDEVDESLWLSLFNPVGAELAGGENTITALGTIRDDDGTGNNVALFVSNPDLREEDNGTKTAVFEIHLSQAYDGDLTFNYQTVDGTAKAGSDYKAVSGTVTFLEGQTTASVEVKINGDTSIEASEFFSLVVTPTAEIANKTAASTGVATLRDDDSVSGLPVISIERTDIVEDNRGFSGNDLTFEINLSEASSDEITFKYELIQDSALDADFGNMAPTGEVTIAAGQTTALLSFRVNGDPGDEVDENVWLKLFNPVNAVLAGGEKEERAIGIIRDDDGTGANLSLFVSDPTVAESDSGQKTVMFQVHLSQAYTSDLTFHYRTADGSAKAGSDYVATQGDISFLAGQTQASVEVKIKGDTAIEGSEQFSLVVSTTSEVKNGSGDHVGLATIFNDDSIHQTIEGTAKADQLSGKSGNDLLYGLKGDDLLDGGTGKDVLVGDAGNDRLIGGAAADELHGGAGADRFIFQTLSESGAKVQAQDTIVDFGVKAGDRIDLHAIDANVKLSGNQAFDFVGGHAFTRAPGELRVDKSGGDTFVYADVNGDRKADFAIQLDGTINLNEDCFVL